MVMTKLKEYRRQALSRGGVLVGMDISHDDVDRCWLVGKDGEEQDLGALFSGELFGVYHEVSKCILLVACVVGKEDQDDCLSEVGEAGLEWSEIVQNILNSKNGEQYLQYLTLVPLEIEIGEPDRSYHGDNVNDPEWRRQIMNRIAESSWDLNEWKMAPLIAAPLSQVLPFAGAGLTSEGE